MNPVQLVSLRIIFVNRKTKREWATTVGSAQLANDLVVSRLAPFRDSRNRVVDAIDHNGKSFVLVEGKPVAVMYGVTYSAEYGNGMFAQTEVLSQHDSQWVIKLVPVFNVSVDADYPVAI